uniref:Uncharacterized protein n=1 Tax=Manihot esculenta TaxID=3983 RepID=A0A2C9VJ35_MANES
MCFHKGSTSFSTSLILMRKFEILFSLQGRPKQS